MKGGSSHEVNSFISDIFAIAGLYAKAGLFPHYYIKRHVQLLNFILVRAPIFGWNTLFKCYSLVLKMKPTLIDIQKMSKRYFSISRFFHEHRCFPGNGTRQRELLYKAPSLGALDMIYLQEHLNELISYMKEHDYSESCIRRLRFIANRMIVLSRTIEWNSYQEILAWYSSQNHKYFKYERDQRRP